MRREKVILIEDEGRDKGKQFTLREMPPMQAEEWFTRALMLLARSGTDVPADIFQQGAAGFVAIGVGIALSGLSKAPWLEVKPLMDEMMTCVVSFQSPGAAAPVTILPQILGQIEEVRTIWLLREEVLNLHVNFSIRAKISEYRIAVAHMITSLGPNTEISRALSEPSSPLN